MYHRLFYRKNIQLDENTGRIIPGVNTTCDVGENEIIIQARKFGFDVDKDGKPPNIYTGKKT